ECRRGSERRAAALAGPAAARETGRAAARRPHLARRARRLRGAVPLYTGVTARPSGLRPTTAPQHALRARQHLLDLPGGHVEPDVLARPPSGDPADHGG